MSSTASEPSQAPISNSQNGAHPGSAPVPGEGRPLLGGGMSTGEAVRRILQVHWFAIALCVLIGVAAGGGIHYRQQPAYQASSQVLLDTPDPQGQTDSEAYADGARAIVTSPTHVAEALAAIHVSRNPATVAARDVTLQPEGTSSVEKITVTDPEPRVAAALANALAANLVRTRLQIRASNAASDAAQSAAITAQIKQLNGRVAQIDAQIQGVDAQLPNANANNVAGLSALATSLASQRVSVVAQQASLVAQQASLAQQQDALIAVRKPTIIGRATPSLTPVSRDIKLDAALGALLGLVLGLGVAALLETLRPTVAGGVNLGRVAGAPFLGRARIGDEVVPDPLLGLRLARARAAAGASRVELGSIGLGADLDAVAWRLESPEGGDGTPPLLHVLGSIATGTPATASAGTGLVLVAPPTVSRRAVERVREWATLTRRPLIGVITLTRKHRWMPLLPRRGGRARRPEARG